MTDSSTSVVMFKPIQPATDTCADNTKDTIVVSVADYPRVDQPSGWLQLFVPVADALFVVFLEKWVAMWYEHRKECEVRMRYRNTILDWITNITTSEKAFNQTVAGLSNRISASSDILPVAFAMPLLLHDSLKDMSIEKMSDAFLSDFKKDKAERYVRMYNIISGFAFLKKMNESVTQSYEAYNKQSFDLCREWNTTYESFTNYYNAMSEQNQYQEIVEAWQTELVKTPGSRKVNLRFLEKLFNKADESKDYRLFLLSTG